MNGRYRILLAVVILLIIWRSAYYFSYLESKDVQETSQINQEENENIEKVTVTVYYEALCPDSKYFIINQLLPTYETLQKYLIIDLVPYGKAETKEINGHIEFHCQHDAVECEANKIHSCVIRDVKDPLTQLKYINCMINDNILPVDAGERCGNELDINYTPIGDCARSIEGSLLLKKNGQRTHNLLPPVHFIPTIELNGSQTLVRQSLILKNLQKAVCQVFNHKPTKCV